MGLLTGKRPGYLGKVKGASGAFELQAVKPRSQNQVSSYATTPYHAIAPLAAKDPAKAWVKLASVVKAMPGANVIDSQADYLYAEFTTKLLGFVDDVEFLLDPANQRIHVRSASRLGRKDFGVNRARIETIRKQLNA